MSTSFRNVFRDGAVRHIEIPMIQRDYAQGRRDANTTRIREAFLGVLRQALVENQPVGLDFIYGEIEDGRLVPLDGQQRLTTLFLLHWYLAARNGIPAEECRFLAEFTYRTRFSARHFCKKLVIERPCCPLPHIGKAGTATLSAWLTDQPWYAGAWKHDPTIQSMLVALDDLHALFAADDQATCRAAWERLVDEEQPVITFDFLSVEDMGLTDELYIKMNSRGKPLTPFEHFKADFEKTLGATSSKARADFARNIDQDWSDLLWPLRDSGTKKEGEEAIIDDEFLRLFHFVGDITVLRRGVSVDDAPFDKDIGRWAKRIYGVDSPVAAQAQDDMFATLGALVREIRERDIKDADGYAAWFGTHFTQRGYRQGCVAIYDKVDLFGDCCANYGDTSGQRRGFPLARTLLLFAFLEYLRHSPRPDAAEAARRLRTIRNLIFASSNEIRPNQMATLLETTAAWMHDGDLDVLKGYNARQIEEEKSKAAFLARFEGHPAVQETLHTLEDRSLLRGCLVAFDLGADADAFVRRARLFHEIFPEDAAIPAPQIRAALLACGPYQQRTQNGRFLFGSPKPTQLEAWRNLLTGASVKGIHAALQTLLDRYGQTEGDLPEARLQSIADAWLEEQEQARHLDWRYYLVKYPAMRSGESGIYASSTERMGFDLCMLNASQLNSYYRDPYLQAVIVASGVREGKNVADCRFYGWDDYHAVDRWIKLQDSDDKLISCRDGGFQLCAPKGPTALAVFSDVCRKHEVGPDLMLAIPQSDEDGRVADGEDRVLKGARLLRDLVEGLRTAGEVAPLAVD
ncbi:DUF262 domain-containing protein [Massilia sp. Root335]|uniref:DUF262 domain-containing protein n=1 Tax=Massilia sp. Root335 TaxID=1736517 RepID=UPI0009E8EB76|nr:DUF262 domain-containing protein [Massilia sp. Root335]